MYWHLDFIVALAEAIRPHVYVELGVRDGDLLNRLVTKADHLIGVDVDPQCEARITRASNVEFRCCSTQEYATQLRKDPIVIDLLFIDADHSRDSVLRDFFDFFPFVRPHGLILMHDTHPGNASLLDATLCGSAYLAADELKNDLREYELMTIPVSPGLTLCRKRKTQLSWQELTNADDTTLPFG